MVKRIFPIVGALVLLGLVAVAGMFYYRNLRGVGTALRAPSGDVTALLPTSREGTLPSESDSPAAVAEGPIKVADGFSLAVFAKDLPGARVMVKDGLGNIWVSQPGAGAVTLLQVTNGNVVSQDPVLRNLNRPHGLAIDPANPLVLYIAEENKISRVPLYSESKLEKIADLPAGGSHTTRTIGFGPDGRLYISVGSTCNACVEKDPRRAAILSMKKDGSDMQTVATGLRNSVFFVWDAQGRMWATDNGRDLLGDDVPPDEVNIIEQGKFYGWPYCYGANVVDTSFNKTSVGQEKCAGATPPVIEIPAHSAALGLAFVPDSSWPAEYRNSLLVAYHGSWNRSVPTGYKVVRWKLDGSGKPQGSEDFVSGFLPRQLAGAEALGRPVYLQSEPGGVLYITDDKAGVIYKATYQKP